MTLTVNDIQENDYGEYRCFAENSQGNGENSVRLERKCHRMFFTESFYHLLFRSNFLCHLKLLHSTH